MLRGAMGGMAVDEYAEKPRPNLYNILKKLKEGKATVNRMCYISKLDE